MRHGNNYNYTPRSKQFPQADKNYDYLTNPSWQQVGGHFSPVDSALTLVDPRHGQTV